MCVGSCGSWYEDTTELSALSCLLCWSSVPRRVFSCYAVVSMIAWGWMTIVGFLFLFHCSFEGLFTDDCTYVCRIAAAKDFSGSCIISIYVPST